MVYLTAFPKVDFKVCTKSTFNDRPEFEKARFSFVYNENELVSATFKNTYERLVLTNIARTDADCGFFLKEHLGTELLVAALLEMKTMWKMNPKRIDGFLSSEDASKHAWDISIPFYYKLPIYIQKHVGISYSFHIYYDQQRNQELQWLNWGDDYKSAAKAVRQKFEKTNTDLYFSFLASELN